jgi:N-acetylglucosaminyl-diphospho-decaprenol L-rhamnosyltransferase
MTENIIVFVSHNSADLVWDSVRRIGEQYRYCVIENGSDEAYERMCAFQRETGLSIEVYRVENRGFGAACNCAAQYFPDDDLLYLNPDCVITADDAALLFNSLKQNRNCVVAPIVLDHRTGAIQNYREAWTGTWTVLFMWLNLGRFRFRFRRRSSVAQKPGHPLWVAGSAFAIQSSTLMHYGGFDERFFLYFEEEDLFRRIVTSGGKCIVVEAATAMHEAGTSTPVRKSVIREFMLISGLYYVSKWYGRAAWAKLASACKFMLWSRACNLFIPSSDRAGLVLRIQQSEFGIQIKAK